MAAGPSRDYLWIRSRTPALEQDVVDSLLEQAESSGFPVEDLIFVEQGE